MSKQKVDIEQLQREAFGDHRGRKPKAPAALSELRKLQGLGASSAYLRLKILAQSRKLHQKNPALYISLNQWIYEIVHGKPKAAIEGKLEVPIQITYRLVEPQQVKESETPLLEEGESESSSEDRPEDSTEPTEVN